MKTNTKLSTGIFALFLFGLTFASAAPRSALAENRADTRQANQNKTSADSTAHEEGHSGSELWSNNCGRCHNKRSPEKFSDASWSVIVHHMRVRANLTGEEERKIREFLESAN